MINYRVLSTKEEGLFHISKPTDIYPLLPLRDSKHKTFLQQVAARFLDLAPLHLFTENDIEHYYALLYIVLHPDGDIPWL